MRELDNRDRHGTSKAPNRVPHLRPKTAIVAHACGVPGRAPRDLRV
jgi:hypothetical protein